MKEKVIIYESFVYVSPNRLKRHSQGYAKERAIDALNISTRARMSEL